MSYWKEKVLPKLKKYFDKPSKKKAGTEASKAFEESKVEFDKEFEEKKEDLKPKVLEVYEASAVEIKALVKERKPEKLKKHSLLVQKFLDELAKIEFPGSKQASEASAKHGPTYVSTTVFYVFEKVSMFIPVEEKVEEKSVEPALIEAPEAEATPTPPAPAVEEATTTTAVVEVVEKEVAVSGQSVVEAAVVEVTAVVEEKKEETAAPK